MGTRIEAVNTYLEGLSAKRREALEALRDLIHETQPDIVETFGWEMPTFNYNNVDVCGFASRKQYISFYCNPDVVDGYRDELSKLNIGRGCIRFNKIDDLPVETIRQIIRQSCE